MQKSKREKPNLANLDEFKKLASSIICPCVKKVKHSKPNPKCKICDGTGKPKIKPLSRILNTPCY